MFLLSYMTVQGSLDAIEGEPLRQET
jgi:hypothetical protein